MKKAHDEPLSSEGAVNLSRRKFLNVSVTGAAIAGAAALSGCMHGAAAGNVSKASAHYQDFPHEGRNCAGCTHFRKPDGCEIVAGTISPDGWCRFHRQA
jgi:hypothetical protein